MVDEVVADEVADEEAPRGRLLPRVVDPRVPRVPRVRDEVVEEEVRDPGGGLRRDAVEDGCLEDGWLEVEGLVVEGLVVAARGLRRSPVSIRARAREGGLDGLGRTWDEWRSEEEVRTRLPEACADLPEGCAGCAGCADLGCATVTSARVRL